MRRTIRSTLWALALSGALVWAAGGGVHAQDRGAPVGAQAVKRPAPLAQGGGDMARLASVPGGSAGDSGTGVTTDFAQNSAGVVPVVPGPLFPPPPGPDVSP